MKVHIQPLWVLMLFGLASTCIVPNARAQQIKPAPLPPFTSVSLQDEEAEEEAAEEEEEDDLDFLDQDLDEIRNTQVAAGAMSAEIESVSRTAQPLARTPAAVYVVTNEMIKRSGARNIPEVLRMVPGLQVARIDASNWAISIRGFNSQYANKLLVQIDGRAVYTPTFSGVLWDQQRLLLKDVDRIEVIRGPGGTVWGANAVNGIINITTKNSADTQGLYGEVGGGTEHEIFSGVRAGGALTDNLTFRLWGTQAKDDGGFRAVGAPTDGFNAGQGGFRMDWTPTQCDMITLQGDFLSGISGVGANPTDANTANTLARWSHQIDDDTDWSVQTYWDQYTRDSQTSSVTQSVYDLDTQFHTKMGCDHDIVTGFGYRTYSTGMEFAPAYALAVVPPRDNFKIISYFAQDTIELLDDELYATLGCKFEHNDFTGFEYQPTAKIVWTPNEKTSIWGSVGRAVRTPSVIDRDLIYTSPAPLPAPGGSFVRMYGNRNVGAEDVISYEMGLRRQPTESFFWDLALFFNRYNALMVVQPTGVTLPPPTMYFNNLTVNGADADTYGFELAATYEVNPCWNVRGSYSFFVENVMIPAGLQTFVTNPGLSPRNQVYFHSGWNLDCCTNLDVSVRYVDSLAAGIPKYLVADIRLARRFGRGLEVALVGQNLLDDHHSEFNGSGLTTPVEVESGFYGMVSYEY